MEVAKRLLAIIAALSLLPTGCQAKEAGAHYRTIPYRSPRVARVEITKASEKSKLDPGEDCSTFVMTPALVTEFFRHAMPVSEEVRMHELDWSACFAEGSVTFADHESGDWTIARYGVGALTMRTGKWKGQTIYLHCRQCEDWNK